jgi:AcrR family transcriptional regulator
LGRAERRDRLLDVAAGMVAAGAVDELSMEAVAERAGVSRPLVYKHFANRQELLAAVYRREAALLHDQLAAEVRGAGSLPDMYRALVHGALRAAAEQGDLFTALRSAGAWSQQIRGEQQDRDRATARAFAARAERELGVERGRAMAGTVMLLSLVDPVLAQWRARPTAAHGALLEETFMTVVSASLAALAAASGGRSAIAGG